MACYEGRGARAKYMRQRARNISGSEHGRKAGRGGGGGGRRKGQVLPKEW